MQAIIHGTNGLTDPAGRCSGWCCHLLQIDRSSWVDPYYEAKLYNGNPLMIRAEGTLYAYIKDDNGLVGPVNSKTYTFNDTEGAESKTYNSLIAAPVFNLANNSSQAPGTELTASAEGGLDVYYYINKSADSPNLNTVYLQGTEYNAAIILAAEMLNPNSWNEEIQIFRCCFRFIYRIDQ